MQLISIDKGTFEANISKCQMNGKIGRAKYYISLTLTLILSHLYAKTNTYLQIHIIMVYLKTICYYFNVYISWVRICTLLTWVLYIRVVVVFFSFIQMNIFVKIINITFINFHML